MADGSWDNGGGPPRKKGMPLWGKIGLGCCGGCALVFLVLLATCVGGVRWASRQGDAAWARMAHVVQALRTEESTRALYRENPRLADNYPNEEDFLKAAEGWRRNLGEFPAERPSLRDLMEGKGSGAHFRIQTENGASHIEYQIPKGGRLHLATESDHLVDLRVE